MPEKNPASAALLTLRDTLESLSTGPVASEDRQEVERLLAEAWDDFFGDDGGMRPDKLSGRTEELTWTPPHLTFSIERHGGTAHGSKYAELQDWTVNIEKGVATLDNPYNPRKRLLKPRQQAIKTGPIADDLGEAMRAGRDHPKLHWTKDRGTVQVRTSEVFPPAAKQTMQGRSKRLRRDLEERLPDWSYGRGGWWMPPQQEE